MGAKEQGDVPNEVWSIVQEWTLPSLLFVIDRTDFLIIRNGPTSEVHQYKCHL